MKSARLTMIFIGLFLLTTCWGPAPAVSNAPSVDAILQRYVQALGGAEAARKLVSLTAEGLFEMPHAAVQGTIRQWSKAPNKTLVTLREIENGPFVTLGFNGKKAWQQRSADSLIFTREIHGSALAQISLNADFYREFKLKELYPRLRWLGPTQIADEAADVIEAEAATGNPEKWYFSRQTGLLLCREALALDDTGDGVEQVQSFYSNYRAVAGVMIPFAAHMKFAATPERNLVIRLSRVSANLPLPDSHFDATSPSKTRK